MKDTAPALTAATAARRLGVSAKALRLYEERGLLSPARTEAGWRAYAEKDMTRAGKIVELRALGLSLSEVAQVLDGDAACLDAALSRHATHLKSKIQHLAEAAERLGTLRAKLAEVPGNPSEVTDILMEPTNRAMASFQLPWPWGGETFEVCSLGALNFITGPLGSGKTRFAQSLARALPNAGYLDLDRKLLEKVEYSGDQATSGEAPTNLEQALTWIGDEGGVRTKALEVVVAAIIAEKPTTLVIDMIEEGLCEATQTALMSYVRLCPLQAKTLLVMTRSNAILDLDEVGPNETIFLCPPNHAPPLRVLPYAGTQGFDALASCLAPPSVRARSHGVVAWRSDATSSFDSP